jgi:hypothetical protein
MDFLTEMGDALPGTNGVNSPNAFMESSRPNTPYRLEVAQRGQAGRTQGGGIRPDLIQSHRS